MEKTEQKDCVLQTAVAIALIILIIIRIVLNDKECGNWISVLNLLGLVFAISTLHDEFKQTFGRSEKFDLITGIYFCIIAGLCIVLIHVWLNLISLNALWSDIVLLVTLLVSLPVRFYKKLVGLWIN